MLEDVLAASLGVGDAQQSAVPPCLLSNVRFLSIRLEEHPSLPSLLTFGFLSIHRFFWTSGSLRRIFSGSARSVLASRRTLGKTCSCGAGPEASAALPLDRLRVAEAVP